MARDPIQFQPGLSLPAFIEQYGMEEQCRAALYRYRWPKGFVCPECGNTTCCQLSRGLYQCHRCHHQTSLTAGTIFHGTHLPLTTWFLATYLLTQRKNGISALQLSRELGVSYNTAWKLKHKLLLQVMHERNQGEKLTGRIEIDDAYLGGERQGKPGRGAEHTFPFVAAVQTDAEGHPQRVQFRCVSGFTLAEIRRYAQQAIVPGSQVISDGLGCFRAFDTSTYVHERHITGGGRASVANPAFNWVNTVRGNVKNAITGNRRYDLKAMLPRFLTVATRTPPMPYRLLKMAEAYA